MPLLTGTRYDDHRTMPLRGNPLGKRAAAIVTRVCWCRDCQYIGAGSGTVNACFRTAAFTVTGKTNDYRSVADSGNQMHRRFCPSCGTPLFSEAEARPHLIFVRVGTFDDPTLAEPAMTIWTSSAPHWAQIDAALPALPTWERGSARAAASSRLNILIAPSQCTIARLLRFTMV